MIYTGGDRDGDGDDPMMGMGRKWGQSDGNGERMGTNQWGWGGDGDEIHYRVIL